MEPYILMLLMQMAPSYDIDHHLAAAVIKTESRFKVNALGGLGEVGLFQIRPEFSKYSKQELFNLHINLIAGLEMLRDAKNRCIHKANKTFVICHNLGIKGARKIKHPELFPYYKKVYANYAEYKRK